MRWLIKFLEVSEEFPGTKKQDQSSHDKRDIGVRVNKILLYLYIFPTYCNDKNHDLPIVAKETAKRLTRTMRTFMMLLVLSA